MASSFNLGRKGIDKVLKCVDSRQAQFLTKRGADPFHLPEQQGLALRLPHTRAQGPAEQQAQVGAPAPARVDAELLVGSDDARDIVHDGLGLELFRGVNGESEEGGEGKVVRRYDSAR